jgi:predicted metal-dependent phosphoesterase TrpH
MRCDLHVHSRFSGPSTLPVLRHLFDESFAEPEAVYEQARRRGMDLITLTDHDTIEGALRIAGRPDTFVSEELTVMLPVGRELHIGVYDVSERQHLALYSRRYDAEALFATIAEQEIPAVLNHPFSSLTGRRRTADLTLAFEQVGLVECCNASLPTELNAAAELSAREWGLGRTGGSDAHTLASVARAHTVVPGASSKQEFLDGLRTGCTLPKGDSGSYARFAADVAQLTASAYARRAREVGCGLAGLARMAALAVAAPLLPLLPLALAAVHVNERRFAARHSEAFRRALLVRPGSGTWMGPAMGPGGTMPAMGAAR